MAEKLHQQFHKDKMHLLQLSERLAQSGAVKNNEKLEAIRLNLQQEKFRLVILGQFKRGKSTLINALLGKRVLPSDVIPVTAVITELKYGPKREAVIFFHEGAPRTVPVGQLADFVAESENPKNKKNVDKVEITCPSPFLSDGLIVVDTPGIGSIHEHNTRLTNEYIPNADAAVFLFSADPPLTELEQAFIKLILPIVPKIFYVLNKKDYLEPEALQRVLQFNAKILKKLEGLPELDILPVSALWGLKEKTAKSNPPPGQSGLPELEAELEYFLMRERGKVLILSNLERLERLCYETKNLIRIERRAQNLSMEELQSHLTRFEQFIRKIQKNQQRLSFLLEGVKSRLIENFDRRQNDFFRQTIKNIKAQSIRFIEANRGQSNAKLGRLVENQINNAIVDAFEPYRLMEEKELKDQYEKELAALNNDVAGIVNEVYAFSAKLFGLKDMEQLPQESWRFKSLFSYKTWETEVTLDILENSMLTLLPKPLFIARQKRMAKDLLRQKLERQGGRLRADILYRLQDSNRQFLYEFSQAVKRIQTEIARLIKKHVDLKRQGEAQLAKILQHQDEILNTLENILNQTEQIKNGWRKIKFL